MVMVSRQRNVSRRGAVAVEAALVLPVLLLVTFGAIRYGWFFIKLQQITNAARCGARAASVYNANHTEVMNIISTLLGPYGARIIADGETPPVTFKITEKDGNSYITTNVASAGAQDKITVTITVPAADVDILPMGLFRFEPEDWELWASITMAKEGVPP